MTSTDAKNRETQMELPSMSRWVSIRNGIEVVTMASPHSLTQPWYDVAESKDEESPPPFGIHERGEDVSDVAPRPFKYVHSPRVVDARLEETPFRRITITTIILSPPPFKTIRVESGKKITFSEFRTDLSQRRKFVSFCNEEEDACSELIFRGKEAIKKLLWLYCLSLMRFSQFKLKECHVIENPMSSYLNYS